MTYPQEPKTTTTNNNSRDDDNHQTTATTTFTTMKETTPPLYPNGQVGEKVDDYARDHSSLLPEYITNYHRHVVNMLRRSAHLMVSQSQAQAMVFITRMVGAQRILEVGSYVGFSSLVWAYATGPSGKVTGLEFDPCFARLANAACAINRVENATVIVGDAMKTLPTLLTTGPPYDIISLSASKRSYPKYLKLILELSRPGGGRRLLKKDGLIIADNSLRCGFVADDSEGNPWTGWERRREGGFGGGGHDRMGKGGDKYHKRREDVKALREFNDMVRDEERLENFLLPLWDGLNLCRLLD